jgi:hypothetical protein
MKKVFQKCQKERIFKIAKTACFQILQTIGAQLPHSALMNPIGEEGGGGAA